MPRFDRDYEYDLDGTSEPHSRRMLLEALHDADVEEAEALELLDEEVLEIEEDEDESPDFDTRDREAVRDIPDEGLSGDQDYNLDDARQYQSEQLLSKEFKG